MPSMAPYTTDEMIAQLRVLIQRIDSGEIVDVPAGTSVEKDHEFEDEVYYTGNGCEFYVADTPVGVIKEL
jgi:hypothetical protein